MKNKSNKINKIRTKFFNMFLYNLKLLVYIIRSKINIWVGKNSCKI